MPIPLLDAIDIVVNPGHGEDKDVSADALLTQRKSQIPSQFAGLVDYLVTERNATYKPRTVSQSTRWLRSLQNIERFFHLSEPVIIRFVAWFSLLVVSLGIVALTVYKVIRMITERWAQ